MSVVVDARVSDSLKRALQARAGARGLSLHAAGVELLKRGLEASEDERASEGLTRELAAATSELDQPRAQLARLTFACRLRWHASS